MTSNRRPINPTRPRRRRVALGVSAVLAIPLLAVIAPSAANADPSAPTDVAATAGAGSATVTWTAPDGGWSGGDGPDDVWAYQINAYVGSTLDTSTTVDAESTSTQSDVFTGLSNGTTYTFTVQDISGGWFDPPYTYSDESAPSNAVTPSNIPSAPTGVTATASSSVAGQIQVSWTAPSNTGGSGIDHYTVTPSAGSPETVPGGSTSTYFDGLSGGYTFTVTATNSTGGTSAASAASGTAVAPTVSAAPTGVSATAAPGQATVTWTAPGGSHSDNSYPNGNWTYTINAYSGGTLQSSTQGGGEVGASQSAVVTGLTGDTSYTFTRHRELWALGRPAVQRGVLTVLGRDNPDRASAPTDVVASPDTDYGDRLNVSWTAPTTSGDGGLASYTVTASNGATQTVSSSSTWNGVHRPDRRHLLHLHGQGHRRRRQHRSRLKRLQQRGGRHPRHGHRARRNPGRWISGSVVNTPGGAFSGTSVYHPWVYEINIYYAGSLLWTRTYYVTDTANAATQSYAVSDLPNGFDFTFSVQAIAGTWGGPWYYSAFSPQTEDITPGT